MLAEKNKEVLPMYRNKKEEEEQCECIAITLFWFCCAGLAYAFLFYLIYLMYIRMHNNEF